MGRLDGQVAVVTGGASGIGAGTVRRFVDEGARVLIADMQQDMGSALADELGAGAEFLEVNVADEQAVRDMVGEAVDRWGRLDCIFNNAGFGGAMGPIAEISEDDYDMTLDVLLKGVFFGIKHASPVMAEQGGGSIINTASICGIRSGYGTHLYSVAKAGVIALTETSALELAESGVRVNAICPGFIATPLAAGKPGAEEERIDKMRERSAMAQPMHRVGEARDIANMALFLASDESEWITGQAHVVDGGLMAGVPWRKQLSWMRESHPIRIYRPDDAGEDR